MLIHFSLPAPWGQPPSLGQHRLGCAWGRAEHGTPLCAKPRQPRPASPDAPAPSAEAYFHFSHKESVTFEETSARGTPRSPVTLPAVRVPSAPWLLRLCLGSGAAGGSVRRPLFRYCLSAMLSFLGGSVLTGLQCLSGSGKSWSLGCFQPVAFVDNAILNTFASGFF